MLVVETIARIRRDHLVRGVPIKKIARDLRVSKNTVRKVVRGDETSFSYERLWCMDLRISISGSASVFESLSCLSSSTHRVATISPEPSTGS